MARHHNMRTEVNSKGARSGHPERWMPREVVKKYVKKLRRRNDKSATKEDY